MTIENPSPSLSIDTPSASTEPRVNIQQIMSKRHSFAVQGLPEDHRQNWPPQMDFQANPQNRDLTQNRYEVTLNVRLQARHQDKVVFELQLDQSGLFVLENIPGGANGACAVRRLPESIISHRRRAVKFIPLAGGLVAGIYSAAGFYGVIPPTSAATNRTGACCLNCASTILSVIFKI